MATERRPTQGGGAQPPEPEHLPCPRCDSTNTKFCYYNNYNFSQPRHFCKSCRRYWTHGGTLRDIPIGGATRKNAKRSRSSSSSSSSHHDFHHLHASPLLLPLAGGGSFTSLLNGSPGNGLMALGGFGFGLNDVGFGMGKMAWPGMVEGGGNTWQLENGETFVGGGDYFAFPDLAISTPRN